MKIRIPLISYEIENHTISNSKIITNAELFLGLFFSFTSIFQKKTTKNYYFSESYSPDLEAIICRLEMRSEGMLEVFPDFNRCATPYRIDVEGALSGYEFRLDLLSPQPGISAQLKEVALLTEVITLLIS